MVSMGKAAVDAEFAVAQSLEVVAVLRLVVAVEHSDVLLTREGLRQRLRK